MNLVMNLGFHKNRELHDQMNNYEVLKYDSIPRSKLIHGGCISVLIQIGLWHPSCIAVIKQIRNDVQKYLNYSNLY
jgi:hypothetical protein